MTKSDLIQQMRDESCTVVQNTRLSKSYYLCQLETKTIARLARPGQFVMIRMVDPPLFPLLRRPFAVMDVKPPHIWLYYEVVGQGTRLLSRQGEGDEVAVLGPSGNSFPPMQDKTILMIAGGRGIAPLFFAAGEYAAQNQVILIYGAKTRDDLNLVEQLKGLPLKHLALFTEDGSAGSKGMVTENLCQLVDQQGAEVTFSCGPERMLAAVSRELHETATQDFVSLEAIMGCGFGVCHSCVVPLKKGGYGKVCTDGTVFPLEAIDWQTYL
jgi:dihydroorotate dehydrogenase electron transfer subunit